MIAESVATRLPRADAKGMLFRAAQAWQLRCGFCGPRGCYAARLIGTNEVVP